MADSNCICSTVQDPHRSNPDREHTMAQDTAATLVSKKCVVILTLPGGLGVREWQDSDVDSLVKHGNNKKVWDNLRDRMPHPYTINDAQWWISHCHEDAQYVATGPWTQETGSKGPPCSTLHAITVHDVAVGTIGVEFGSDVSKRSAELGYWLGEEYWGRGIMSAIVPAYVDWVWRTWPRLLRLDAGTYEWNVASGKLLEKAGFKYEGRKEAAMWKNGKVSADLIYGAVRPRELWQASDKYWNVR